MAWSEYSQEQHAHLQFSKMMVVPRQETQILVHSGYRMLVVLQEGLGVETSRRSVRSGL